MAQNVQLLPDVSAPSAAAAPFELLRVRSMAYVDAKPLKTVFFDFVVRN